MFEWNKSINQSNPISAIYRRNWNPSNISVVRAFLWHPNTHTYSYRDFAAREPNPSKMRYFYHFSNLVRQTNQKKKKNLNVNQILNWILSKWHAPKRHTRTHSHTNHWGQPWTMWHFAIRTQPHYNESARFFIKAIISWIFFFFYS